MKQGRIPSHTEVCFQVPILLYTSNNHLIEVPKKLLPTDLTRLEYIILLKLPIILSSIFFILTHYSKIILSTNHLTISLIYIAMLKITI